jgi:hypothetical protein
MTISSEIRKVGPFIGNGVQTVFPFPFKIFRPDHLLAIRATPGGVETALTLGTDYAVTLNADQEVHPGGVATLPSPLPTGYRLALTSDVEELQHVDLQNQGGFYPDVVENEFDWLTILIQQLLEQIGRAVKAPITSGINPDDLLSELYQRVSDAIQAALDAANALAAALQAAQQAANSANAAANAANSAANSASSAANSVPDDVGYDPISVWTDILPITELNANHYSAYEDGEYVVTQILRLRCGQSDTVTLTLGKLSDAQGPASSVTIPLIDGADTDTPLVRDVAFVLLPQHYFRINCNLALSELVWAYQLRNIVRFPMPT